MTRRTFAKALASLVALPALAWVGASEPAPRAWVRLPNRLGWIDTSMYDVPLPLLGPNCRCVLPAQLHYVRIHGTVKL